MTPSTIWIVLAAFLAVMEMMTGTFYLLVAAFGFCAAGLCAALGFGITFQIMVAAVVSLIGWALVHQFTPAHAHQQAASNPDVNLDIGAGVRIASVNADSTLNVSYRGTNWAAVVEGGPVDLNANYVIVRVEGAKLILSQKPG